MPDPDAALVLIDIQKGFLEPHWGPRNNPDAEERAADLLCAWRNASAPVYHVQHLSLEPDSSLRAGQPGAAFQLLVQPLTHEPVITKHVNSAFIGTTLEAQLRAANVKQVVIAGLTTDHCVSTTTRMAGNLGFEVWLVHDAAATFDRQGRDGHIYAAQDIHDIHLASLDGEFARVVGSTEVLRAMSS